MMPIHKFLRLSSSLTAHLAAPDRYQRLISVVQQLIPCDAVALLTLKDSLLIPVAWAGLVPEVGGMVFSPNDHPRLKKILDSSNGLSTPVRFPLDSPLPDPWDGLMLSDPHACAKVHACMGCPLVVDGNVLGLLSVDAINPGAFNSIDDETLSIFANIAAAAVHTAGLIDALELAHRKQGAILSNITNTNENSSDRLLGTTPVMTRLRQEIDLVGNSELTVLITGETGVGKELVAAALHSASIRKNKPLVHFNCATLTESLAESQLFGHRKGSFTGATDDRLGIFEIADGSTLFLDEVGELPLNIQSKLLRALQQGEVQRVGDSIPYKVDVRVIAATNRNLDDEQKKGKFRSDLYYRLAVYPIHVPALRRRRDDIPLLTGHFLEREARRLGCNSIRLNNEARQLLLLTDWPGNVRELEHVLMRAAIRSAGTDRSSGDVVIECTHLEINNIFLDHEEKSAHAYESENQLSKPIIVPTDFPLHNEPSSKNLRDRQSEFTRLIIIHTLKSHQGKLSISSRALGITPSNLQRLIKRLDIKEYRSS